MHAPCVSGQVSFRNLGGGGAGDVSADGRTVLFNHGLWTAERGYEPLPAAWPGYQGREGLALSADGRIVVGRMTWPTGALAMVWRYENGGFVTEPIGQPIGGRFNQCWDVNADGSVAVGNQQPLGMRSTRGGTIETYTEVSNVWGVSADGRRMVGQPHSWQRISVWEEGLGWTALTVPFPGYWDVNAMRADGLSFVGSHVNGGRAVPYVWTPSEGFRFIDGGPGEQGWNATGVSADGSVIVGAYYSLGNDRAAVWTEGTGWRRLIDILREGGLDMTGWELYTPTAVSWDGRTIVGWGYRNGAQTGYVATIPAPAGAAALGLAGLLAPRRRR
ncbi:MAG: hypothetical protein FJ255_02140 [Phycisphaerae bacterium]|nr:hypothetical protein [Phycisphaerae bacterium]